MAQCKPGTRLKSAVCNSEVMVVLASSADVELTCGGVPMGEIGADASGGQSLSPDHCDGTLIGKRYVNEAGDFEVLCTKPGEGSLAIDGAALTVKGAKPLPSSD